MKKRPLMESTAFRFLISCAAAFSVLAVCSKSSFLYPMNDWVDVNCFVTVARGWMNGLLPYRDLMEQKGPLIYLIHAIGLVFSPGNYHGLFLLEVINQAAAYQQAIVHVLKGLTVVGKFRQTASGADDNLDTTLQQLLNSSRCLGGNLFGRIKQCSVHIKRQQTVVIFFRHHSSSP